MTGAVTLDGVLALNFRQGFVSQPGNVFTLLAATGGVSRAFDAMQVTGLPPGFQYQLTVQNGQVLFRITGSSGPYRRFLPLVLRRR